jgi:hypothetical protein
VDDGLLLEPDCPVVQALISTAMTITPATMEQLSFRESNLANPLSRLLRRVGRRSGSHRGYLAGIAASGRNRLVVARVLQFPLAATRAGRYSPDPKHLADAFTFGGLHMRRTADGGRRSANGGRRMEHNVFR